MRQALLPLAASLSAQLSSALSLASTVRAGLSECNSNETQR
jgi:hypothetical protein